MIFSTNTAREAKGGWLARKDGMHDVSWAELGLWPSGIAFTEIHLSYIFNAQIYQVLMGSWLLCR